MNKPRIKKLIKHLRSDKLGHKVFDFMYVNHNENEEEPTEIYQCGTIGCAMGEFPILWPKVFMFDYHGINWIEGASDALSFRSLKVVCEWLELPLEDALKLFYPNQTIVEITLGSKATKEQVADRLEIYLNQ